MSPGNAVGALADLSDDMLALRSQQGDDLAQRVLIERYRRLARAKGRGYFLVGGDAQDTEQEALIGLYKAVRDYRSGRPASFRAFAELCINRQLITAIKAATRQKHQPLNQYVSISGVAGGDDGGERTVADLLGRHRVTDPVDEVIAAERMASMQGAIAEMLSDLEVEVLELYVEGKSYQEIGEQLGRHAKSIDNAIQRIKRKVDLHLGQQAAAERGALTG
ncbi:MAG: RNA polymerase sporulation sigma factor SigH [Acidimicrobiales bacterium]